MNTNNNNNNQSANNNNNNSNIGENSLNLSAEIPDFHVIQDMSDLAESASQFEERIGDEEDISRDFQWLDFYTNQTHYRNAEWRSSPIPRTRTNQNGQNLVLHEYSGGVSYNNAQSNTGSNQFGITNVDISENIQYGDYSDSDFYDRFQQQQQPVVPQQQERPVQSGNNINFIDDSNERDAN